MDERWKDIKGFNGLYAISSYGRVKSYKTDLNGRILSTPPNSKGYPSVSLNKNGVAKTVSIHRLVALHFLSNSDKKPQVNHKSGNRLDNRVENLEWVTCSENIKHSYDYLGRISPATGVACNRKLTDEQVLIIRSSSESLSVLARRYGVSPSSISFVKNKKSFANV